MRKEMKEFLAKVINLCERLERSLVSDPKLARRPFGSLPDEVQLALVTAAFFRKKAEELLKDEFTPPLNGRVN